MGLLDRTIRVILAAVISYLYFAGAVSGTIGIVLMVLSIVFLATSFLSFCPLYLPFGLSTLRKREHGKS